MAQTPQKPPMMALHEMMEVHEVLNFKTVCCFKSKMMSGLAKDADLKALLERDVEQSITAIQAILALYPNPDMVPNQMQLMQAAMQSQQGQQQQSQQGQQQQSQQQQPDQSQTH